VKIGLAVLALIGFITVPARADVVVPPFQPAAGITVVDTAGVPDHPRQLNVRVSSDALGEDHPVDVRILLPAGYDGSTDRYPVLYLFHGTSGRASDWVTTGNAEATTDGLPLIVVMPDAGFNGNGGGWFTNWVDQGTGLGPNRWESFHVDQLIPWIDANLRTIPTREGRAVAGLSQGGFGSTTYAARHPDLFLSVASFSGAPDIDYNPLVAAGATAIIEATAFGLNRTQPEAMFGSHATNAINWQGHDPATIVTNLLPVDVWLYTATGAPGRHDDDPSTYNPATSGIEWATYGSTSSFVQRAQQLGVSVHVNDYTFGTHTWAYWADDLDQYLDQLMPDPAVPAFVSHTVAPSTVSYMSVDQHWTQWGWTVDVARTPVQQFTALKNASASGFTLEGTGTATVTTPAVYEPGLHTVTINGVPTPIEAVDGRLVIRVPLGPDVPLPAVMGVPAPTGVAVTVTIA
jgi:S-formylglutathione hydrolase FrmB